MKTSLAFPSLGSLARMTFLGIAMSASALAFGHDVACAQGMTRTQAYAAARVDTTFDLVAALPTAPPVMLPMAQKGDLLVPLGCLGASGDYQAECMDVAYEPPAEPSIVLETSEGTTTTLMRLDAMTVAGDLSGLEVGAR